MEFKFAVGESEKHTMQFRYSRLANTVRIDIDESMVKRDIFWLWIPAFRRYEFEVGVTDSSNVLIEMSIPRTAAKFINPSCRVTVNGKVVGEY